MNPLHLPHKSALLTRIRRMTNKHKDQIGESHIDDTTNYRNNMNHRCDLNLWYSMNRVTNPNLTSWNYSLYGDDVDEWRGCDVKKAEMDLSEVFLFRISSAMFRWWLWCLPPLFSYVSLYRSYFYRWEGGGGAYTTDGARSRHRLLS